MSWLSDFLSALKPSSREEHFWAKIAGEEELENDIIPSSREEGFMYKIAQKTQSGGVEVVTITAQSGLKWTSDKPITKSALDNGCLFNFVSADGTGTSYGAVTTSYDSSSGTIQIVLMAGFVTVTVEADSPSAGSYTFQMG